MTKPSQLHKTVITIWTDYDPSGLEIETLAREAANGDAFCSGQTSTIITDQGEFPDTDFFGIPAIG